MFSHFNHSQFKRYILAFGSLFSRLVLTRDTADGTEVQRITVPVWYGPKERWYTRLVTDPDLQQGVAQVLPIIAYEVSAVSYDPSRHLNTMNNLRFPTEDARKLGRMYVGVPYTLTFDMAVLVKLQQDGLQIVEQIFPYFTPDLTMALNVIPEFGLIDQIPLTLNAVTHTDDYEGNFEKTRSITWNFSFGMKVNFYGPKRKQSRIEEIFVDLYNAPIDGITNPPQHIITEDNFSMELEDETGTLVTENTANTYLSTGRVARVHVVADPGQDPSTTLPDDILSETTLTEYDGDVVRTRTVDTDETA